MPYLPTRAEAAKLTGANLAYVNTAANLTAVERRAVDFGSEIHNWSTDSEIDRTVLRIGVDLTKASIDRLTEPLPDLLAGAAEAAE